MNCLGCSARRTERRSRDSMLYTARLRAPSNVMIRPKNLLIGAL